jgi:hypothetical protein
MSDQTEIARLKDEVARLQSQLKAQQMPVRSDTASLIKNHELITDCCRFSEGLLTEQEVRKRWHLTDEDWERAGSDDALVRAIQDEKIRRVRNGSHAKEKAQKVFIKAPDVLDEILSDKSASPRHKIESSRELRAIAAVGPEARPTEERYSIVINLGEDHKLVIDKPIRPTAHDTEVIEQELIPMIAAKNREDGGSGEPL